jgi:hypothetical protein
MRDDVKERKTATLGSRRRVSRRRLRVAALWPGVQIDDQVPRGKGYKKDAKISGLSRARVCTAGEESSPVPQAPTTRETHSTARRDASMAGSSAATLCEGMSAPPAVMSPPRRAWWHRRDERALKQWRARVRLEISPASFMLKGGRPYDWGGVEPKALGGYPCTPVRQRFTRDAKLKDVSQIAKRIGTLHRPTTADVLVMVFTRDRRRQKCGSLASSTYDAALCCHAEICRSPSEVVMLREVLPWSADGRPREVGESGHGEYRHESAQASESRGESRVGVFGANRSMASRARGATVESRWSVSVSRPAARTDWTSTRRRATTRQLVTLHGGMGRDVVTLGTVKRFVVSEIKRLGWLAAKAVVPVVVAACVCILCASFGGDELPAARLHEHRVFLGEVEDATAPAAPRKP